MNYVNYEEQYNKGIYELYSDFQKEEDFVKEMKEEEFCNFVFKNHRFQNEGAFVALDGDKVVGFVGANVDEANYNKPEAAGYVHSICVKKEYRRQGIGTKLLELAENFIQSKGVGASRVLFLGAVNYPWYIPHTNHHMHPGLPGVKMNSEHYIFLYHHGYFVNSIHEGFHVDLTNYEFPQKVKDILAKNHEDGIEVELYDPNKHFGVDEFCDEITEAGNAGFANSIRYNLYKREKPFPFVIASDHGRMVGWTGSIYREESGRGHLDGIMVSPKMGGRGLGTAIFATLCKELKALGSEYMTLFTGIDNKARYIYMGAGFNVACSFADMKKNFDHHHKKF